MKKLFATLLLFGLSSALPAKASPAAEACINSLFKRSEDAPESASLLVTVDHAGSQYHAIKQTFVAPRPDMEADGMVYIRTDASGGCEKLLTYQMGSFPDERVYNEKLGPEVNRKITEAFKQQR
ncbi:hypothetical protein [Acaryochloris marina]|uniref:hypothetical protein n=1 Tax=Acaryochloris marina TaxID=155978 RepID=UPI001BAE9142|nr:hypothetical protein [Acaryochloris marina]QUY46149.1 hypothetical protein I1H34_30950 [Acaryochloris marina S15]